MIKVVLFCLLGVAQQTLAQAPTVRCRPFLFQTFTSIENIHILNHQLIRHKCIYKNKRSEKCRSNISCFIMDYLWINSFFNLSLSLAWGRQFLSDKRCDECGSSCGWSWQCFNPGQTHFKFYFINSMVLHRVVNLWYFNLMNLLCKLISLHVCMQHWSTVTSAVQCEITLKNPSIQFCPINVVFLAIMT